LSGDFVVQDNDFLSIKNSIRWGRNLIVNVRRFVQFSLSAIVPCIVLIALSGGVFGRSPFTLQQILLIDMLTGTGAAVSLATEAPEKLITRSERKKEKESILISCMTRDIIAQVVYQSLVLGILLFSAPAIFGIKYELYNTPLRDGPNAEPTNRLIHQTFLFEIFVIMNLFNLFNCRRLSTIDHTSINVFSSLVGNWYFLIVLLVTVNFIFAVSNFVWLRFLFGMAELTGQMHFVALALGVGSLVVGILVKLTPLRWAKSLGDSESEDAKVWRHSFTSLDGSLTLQK